MKYLSFYRDLSNIFAIIIKDYVINEVDIDILCNRNRIFERFCCYVQTNISWEENFIFVYYISISFVIRGCTISQIKIKDKEVGKKVITLEKGFSHNRYPEPTLHILFYWFPMLLLIPKEAINDMVFRHRKMMQYQMWKYAGDIIYILLSFLWRKIKLKYGTMEILFSCRELRNLNLAFS